MTAPPPLQLLVGPRGHGVVGYAADVAHAVQAVDGRTSVVVVDDVAEAIARARDSTRTHVHVTDHLFGRSPEDAADNIELLAEVTRLTVTVHDVPQTSDGTVLPRRIAAYSRFMDAARAVTVNSRHEQSLVAEFLPVSTTPHMIPLGARAAAPPPAPAYDSSAVGVRDLVVLLAGYIYPGKGHARAIEAAAQAADVLRAAGDPVGSVVVRAIGRPSAGHERDVLRLEADAQRRGVRFEVTGFLSAAEFARRIGQAGIPLAAHEHVSASRSMLDWAEAGRRALVVGSRYAEEMDALRPGTMFLYAAEDLPDHLVRAWRKPALTYLDAGASLAPDLHEVADQYRAWWDSVIGR